MQVITAYGIYSHGHRIGSSCGTKVNWSVRRLFQTDATHARYAPVFPYGNRRGVRVDEPYSGYYAYAALFLQCACVAGGCHRHGETASDALQTRFIPPPHEVNVDRGLRRSSLDKGPVVPQDHIGPPCWRCGRPPRQPATLFHHEHSRARYEGDNASVYPLTRCCPRANLFNCQSHYPGQGQGARGGRDWPQASPLGKPFPISSRTTRLGSLHQLL